MTSEGTARRPLGWLLLLAVAATVAVAAIWASGSGMHAMVVTSESMAPTLTIGDIVIVDPAVPPAPGAIIVVDRDGTRVTHRVVTATPTELVLRGDATTVPDPPDPAGTAVGTVIRVVPAVGLPAVAAHGRPWVPAVIGAAIAAAILTVGGRRHGPTDTHRRAARAG